MRLRLFDERDFLMYFASSRSSQEESMTQGASAARARMLGPEPSMDRSQTVEFLRLNGVRRMEITADMFERWPADTPVLYVFEDSLGIDAFKLHHPSRRPSVVRVDRPFIVRPSGFFVSQGQADYYAIDPETLEIYRMKTSLHRNRQFNASPVYLFETADKLFRKSP